MSNPSNQQQNSICSSSYAFIPNKKHDFHQIKIPFIISLAPFNEKYENQVKNFKYSYYYVPKCCRCKAISFPAIIKNKQYNRHSYWNCLICDQENIFKSSYLKIHSYFESDSTIFDFYHPILQQKPKFTEDQPTFSYQNESFLFILELTSSTQNHQFFIEALNCIKNQMENKNTGFVSIFIVNSHFHFPTIQRNSTTLTTTYDIINHEFPPFQKLFFDLSNQKKLFLDFILFLNASVQNHSLDQTETTDISIYDIFQIIIKLVQNKNIKCIFLASQIAKDNENHSIYKSIKELTFSMADSVLPFDFFLIENMYSNHNFDILRENVFISNGFINFYNDCSSQISFFSDDFCDRINNFHYDKVDIRAIVPPSLKIADIHGCGVRTSDTDFSLTTMDINDSIYYFVDFSSSEINHGESLYFQFQVIYHDSNNERRIRIINHQIIAYDGIEMATSKINCGVLLAGCINQAIDAAREEENVNKAIETMKQFYQIFNSEKNAKFFFQHQNQPFQINWFQNILNASLNNLYLPLFWSFLLGKLSDDIQLLFSPLLYKINLNDFSSIGPFLISNSNFDPGIYFIVLAKNRGALFAFCKENESQNSNMISEIDKEKVQEMFPKIKMTFICSPIQSVNDLKKNFLILQ